MTRSQIAGSITKRNMEQKPCLCWSDSVCVTAFRGWSGWGIVFMNGRVLEGRQRSNSGIWYGCHSGGYC